MDRYLTSSKRKLPRTLQNRTAAVSRHITTSHVFPYSGGRKIEPQNLNRASNGVYQPLLCVLKQHFLTKPTTETVTFIHGNSGQGHVFETGCRTNAP